MTLEQAIELLRKEYERAKGLEFVHDPLAYALYQVWKIAGNSVNFASTETDLTDKCGSCKWAVPHKFAQKGQFGAYVKCKNPNKVWRSPVSMIKQRTNPKCRYYERSNK